MAPEKGAQSVVSPERNLVIETMIRSSRNQLLVRGANKAGTALVASGMAGLSSKPLTKVTRRTVKAKKNPKGRVVVKEHRQTTISRTRTEGGRNFLSQQQRKKPAARSARRIIAGRSLPVMAYGFIAYDVMTQQQVPGKNWFGISEADARYLADNPQIIKNEIAAASGAHQKSIKQIVTAVQFGIMIGGAIFG